MGNFENTTAKNWRDKVSNISQAGGIETSVLDNGHGRGSRIAWFNTGSGFRFKLALDRSMDITEAFFNRHSLAWISNQGTAPAQPFADKGIDWLKNFGGGLMTTCGLSHIGGPENDKNGTRGLHGEISNVPAEIESIIQPDLVNGNNEMSITARIKQTRVFGPHLELKRTISGTLFSPVIKIRDTVRNIGNMPTPHMLLYHFNFGWPLVDEGTEIIWDGDWKSRGGELDNKIFNKDHDFKKCQPVLEEHSGYGEAAGFIDPQANNNGHYTCGLYNPSLELAVTLQTKKSQLPALTNWQHWGKREYVLGLEPGTNHPIGQGKAKNEGSLRMLGPGESSAYEIELSILTDSESIQKFTKA